jgi:ribosome maturation factor RimP
MLFLFLKVKIFGQRHQNIIHLQQQKRNKRRERVRSLLLFLAVVMVNETIKAVESLVQALLAGESGYFLVDVRIKPTNNLKVYIDGDQGISIEKCVQYNRALYKKLEESGLFPTGDFSLEVSSPGLDEPLKLLRQYRKNIGRQVELVLQDGSKKEGRLLEVSEDGIIVEETRGKNKKKEVINHTFLFDNIKTTKIQVVF